ncbi:MAG: NAD(+)/NADH kinase [Candidatus Bathyarchaeota archaeon]|nr:MAG: NAD(+)/NADH kinase [Candidatus Bathyarchaeota archaeon]
MASQEGVKKLETVLLVSQNETSEVRSLLIKGGFKLVERNPDFIVCYGGDGTVLFAERNFPQIPKLIIKRTKICRKCDYTFYDMNNVISKIRDEKFVIKKEIKIETRIKNEKLIGLNEIQVHTKLPIYAIRFSVSVGKQRFENLIGDGVIVATPFGSTGYYKSTGGKQFEEGLGVAFNNLHNKNVESFVVDGDSLVEVKMNRGPAWVLADNNERFLQLESDDAITIKKSESLANLIYVL